MRTVIIDDDFGSWRAAARQLLAVEVPPAQIEWRTDDASTTATTRRQRDGFLFDAPQASFADTAGERVPRCALSGVRIDAVGMALAGGDALMYADRTEHAFESADQFRDNATIERRGDPAFDPNFNPNFDPAAQKPPSRSSESTDQADPHHLPASGTDAPAVFAVPREVLKRIRTAARAADPHRWAFLYRVVWRYAHGDHAAVLPGDIDGERLTRLARQVSREFHHWRAFLRFSETALSDASPSPADMLERGLDAAARACGTDGPALVAWCEPEHDILEPLARYFEKRLGRSRWMIATPDGVARHDRDGLDIDRSARQQRPASQDEVEQLWRAYFRSIFNPARVNPALTRQHLPLRYWKHLPEGDLIPRLAAEASAGQRRHAQAPALRGASGKRVAISPDDAQPRRDAPTSLDACRRCPLWEHATQAVGGVGPEKARLMLVGEQPGDQEDLSGKPFVGPAGQLLDRALASADVAREQVYVTNAVKHFKWEPRGKRRLHKTPAQREIDACHIWLEQEIDAHRPRVLVALGATALKSLSGSKAKLSGVLNQPYEQDGMWIVPTYHPSYALRAPDAEARAAAERTIVEALRRARALLEQPQR